MSIHHGRRSLARRVLIPAFCLLTSCRQPAAPPPAAVTDTQERGPIRLQVEVRPPLVWLGDPITVDLNVHTPDEYSVEFPAADALTGWEVTGVESPDPRPGAEGGLVWRRTFTLTSLSSGVREIPPLAVKYLRKGSADAADGTAQRNYPSELVSSTLNVEVRSALTSQDSVRTPRDVTGTLLPPRHWTWRDWALRVGLPAVGALLLILAIWLIRRRLMRPSPPLSPIVWALRELAALGRGDWLESGRVREYYYRLSEIVRVYIERQFGLAASEMTTEEFLGTLAHRRSALPYDADRLRSFMETWDVVKYAAFKPRREDGETALGSARAFVDATAAVAEGTEARRHEGTKARDRGIDGSRDQGGGPASGRSFLTGSAPDQKDRPEAGPPVSGAPGGDGPA